MIDITAKISIVDGKRVCSGARGIWGRCLCGKDRSGSCMGWSGSGRSTRPYAEVSETVEGYSLKAGKKDLDQLVNW
jgi:hypothetical protein